MQPIQIVGVAIIVGLVILNLYATVRIVRDALSERIQKSFQVVLVWLVPVIGAVLVLFLQRKESFQRRQYEINSDDPFAGRA